MKQLSPMEQSIITDMTNHPTQQLSGAEWSRRAGCDPTIFYRASRKPEFQKALRDAQAVMINSSMLPRTAKQIDRAMESTAAAKLMFQIDGTHTETPLIQTNIAVSQTSLTIPIAQIRKAYELGKTVEIPDLNAHLRRGKRVGGESVPFSSPCPKPVSTLKSIGNSVLDPSNAQDLDLLGPVVEQPPFPPGPVDGTPSSPHQTHNTYVDHDGNTVIPACVSIQSDDDKPVCVGLNSIPPGGAVNDTHVPTCVSDDDKWRANYKSDSDKPNAHEFFESQGIKADEE